MTNENHDENRHPERGFTLLEAVIAAGLIAGACAALAQMFAMSIATNIAARGASAAAILATQKLEQLRQSATGPGAGVDYLSQSGEVVPDAGMMPPEAAYVRRWSAQALPGSPGMLVLQVAVSARRGSGAGRDIARLATLRGRRTP